MANDDSNQTMRENEEAMNITSTQSTESANQGLIWKIICLVVFLGMVAVNALASLLPINGLDTGAISDSYPNLFAPAGITFSIWGLIYLLLAAFVIFQFFTPVSYEAGKRMQWTRVLFVISSLANIGWIFCWHYLQILASLILMLVILICLAIAHFKQTKVKMKVGEYLFLRLPFSVYFGWITVATVANVTTWLVSIGWDGWIFSEEIWTVIILAVATIVALAVITSRGSWAYGATIVWAYAGILIKHLDPAAFASEYTTVIVTASICLGLLAASSLLAIFGRKIRLTA